MKTVLVIAAIISIVGYLLYTQSVMRKQKSLKQMLDEKTLPPGANAVQARVVKKEMYRVTVAGVDTDDYTPGKSPQEQGRYRVTFEAPDGTQQTMAVHPQHYGAMNEGDAGVLIFAGKTFLRFEKQSEADRNALDNRYEDM